VVGGSGLVGHKSLTDGLRQKNDKDTCGDKGKMILVFLWRIGQYFG